MRAGGTDVISLAAGEPDFNTPEPIVQAAIDALHAGFTKYTPTSGIPELKDAVVAKFRRENGLSVEPANIVVSCGAKQCLFNAFQATVNSGDEVVVFAPFWPTYADQIALAGAHPVIVPTLGADAFVPDPAAVRAAITPRTRAILLNSPCNPTGAVMPRSVLKEIAALALRHDLWLISDEIYEKLVYDGTPLGIASLGQDVADRTVTINGCSKSYAMTGWRIGYCAAPKALAASMSNIQDQVTSNATSFAQKGAVVALQMPDDDVSAMRAEFRARRDLVVSLLADIEGVDIRTPAGAFYAFPDIGAHLGGRFPDDAALALCLLQEAHVATIPGSAFGAPGHLRLSYAASRENLKLGVARIAEALRRPS